MERLTTIAVDGKTLRGSFDAFADHTAFAALMQAEKPLDAETLAKTFRQGAEADAPIANRPRAGLAASLATCIRATAKPSRYGARREGTPRSRVPSTPPPTLRGLAPPLNSTHAECGIRPLTPARDLVWWGRGGVKGVAWADFRVNESPEGACNALLQRRATPPLGMPREV